VKTPEKPYCQFNLHGPANYPREMFFNGEMNKIKLKKKLFLILCYSINIKYHVIIIHIIEI